MTHTLLLKLENKKAVSLPEGGHTWTGRREEIDVGHAVYNVVAVLLKVSKREEDVKKTTFL